MLFYIFITFFAISLVLTIIGLIIKNFPMTLLFGIALLILSITLLTEGIVYQSGKDITISEVTELNVTKTNQTEVPIYEKLFLSDLTVKAIAIISLMFSLYALLTAALGFFGGD